MLAEGAVFFGDILSGSSADESSRRKVGGTIAGSKGTMAKLGFGCILWNQARRKQSDWAIIKFYWLFIWRLPNRQILINTETEWRKECIERLVHHVLDFITNVHNIIPFVMKRRILNSTNKSLDMAIDELWWTMPLLRQYIVAVKFLWCFKWKKKIRWSNNISPNFLN